MKTINSKLVLLGTVCLLSACGVTEQASKVQDTVQSLGGAQDLVGMTKGVSQTINAVKSGNFDQAKQEFSSVQQNWTAVESKLKASPDTINNLKNSVQTIATDLKASPPDKAKLISNLQSLSGSITTIAKGEDGTQTASASGDTADAPIGGAELPNADKAKAFNDNLVAMKDALAQTTTAVESKDFSAAKESFGNARQTWYKFGGGVKEKSAEAYQTLDQGVKTVNTALSQAAPTQDALRSELKTMTSKLETVSTN
ncbi:MAG: hypothetical protein ACFCU8_11895 [Thermosynechococcaceae cyanobacterium]